ncbi:glycosyltransferase family 4 protein [Winogradskyella sp. SYSU M77433]|uniref:glycosyltransferase family 4 protein n=1 Tax=Winogradskyella sp. SYSU M77433 TaxID=3042722 RepID=UPI00248076C0|nr:glycosyltransferase family 4 protein [Winogradskyella sp. SYSU M77433]MDH7912993.1 glycosyltransferase family 4 protein [Winogradskyella sp. SYSU M77433]
MSLKPIRILYTIPNFKTAGSQNVLLSILRGLDSEKFEAFIAVEKFPELIPDDIPISNQIHIQYTGKLKKDVSQFLQILKTHAIDICHSWDYKSTSVEVLTCRLSGVKYLYTKKNNAWSKRWLLKSILANYIAYDNPEMKSRFFHAFYLRSKITFIPHGVDLNKFSVKENQTSDVFNLCCIGNIVANKNQKQIIEALLNLPNDVHLNLYGKEDEAYKDQLVHFIEENHLQKRVSFKGFVKNDDIPQVLSQQHIFVLSSIQEGLPVSILEALACGVPVLSSNSGGGAKYILKDEKGGFIFNSTNELVEKIEILSNNKELYSKLKQEAVENVKSRFSLIKEINAYKNLYLKLIGK